MPSFQYVPRGGNVRVCLERGYVPAGETYLLCSIFAPVSELAGGCS